MDKIKDRIISPEATLFDAIKMMDKIASKTLFVFDGSTFAGLFTMGDIQRAIIKDISLSSSIRTVIDTKKIYAAKDESREEIIAKMRSMRAECMPVVNDEGQLVDVIFWKDILDNETRPSREKINLPVVIMAGGLGTRLKPLTNIIPKPLIPIGDKTILEKIMDRFESIGCTRFHMSVNYKYDLIEYYLSQLDHNYDISFFREEKPLGTIGSVSLLKNKISTPFFVSNCDILIDQDYRDVYDYHMENANEITIVTAVKTYSIPYGVIESGKNGVMTDIQEKPEFTYMINTGVYILNPELIDEIPNGEFFHITDLMDKVRARGGRIGCFPVSEKSWTDIGEWNEYVKIVSREQK